MTDPIVSVRAFRWALEKGAVLLAGELPLLCLDLWRPAWSGTVGSPWTVILWLAAAITIRAVVAAVRPAAATTDSLSSTLERLKVGIESLYLGCLIPILGKLELIKVELQGWDRQSTQLGLRGCQWKNWGVSALISPGRLPSGHVFTAEVGQNWFTVGELELVYQNWRWSSQLE